MVYPNHQILQLQGTIGPAADPYEIWSTSLKFVSRTDTGGGGSSPVSMDLDELSDYIDTVILPAVQSLSGLSALSVAGGSVKVTTVKFNDVGPDGLYTNNPSVQRELAPQSFGGTSTLTYPTQIAKVVTLESGFYRGPASRGRMYIPGPTNTYNPTTGLLTITQTEVDAWGTWVESMAGSTTAGGRTLNVVPAVVSSIGDGFAWREITGVSMDNRADVQRRRANDLQGQRLFS